MDSPLTPTLTADAGPRVALAMAADRTLLWCAHPHIQPGEALSSWLHRSAVANGLTDHCYARRALPDFPVWTRDIDRLADTPLLEQAAQASGETLARLQQAVLRSFEGRMFAHHTLNSWLSWVMPIGVFHRLRLHHGQQYCAACLAERPVARLRWRLAWQLYCPQHGTRLHDACPCCDAPFVFHRVSASIAGRLACHMCGYNLLRGGAALSRMEHAWHLQQSLSNALAGRAVTIGPCRLSPLEFSSGVRVLVRGITNRARLPGLADAMPRAARVAMALAVKRPTPPFEYWRLPARERGMDIIGRILQDWPGHFVRSSRRFGIYRCRFDGLERVSGPLWVTDALLQLER